MTSYGLADYLQFPIQKLPNELLVEVFNYLGDQAALNLGSTCQSMKGRVLPLLYKRDAQREDVPLALQWATIYHHPATAKLSLQAATAVGIDRTAMINRSFDLEKCPHCDSHPGMNIWRDCKLSWVLDTDMCLLHVACYVLIYNDDRDVSIIELLCDAGANVSQTTPEGLTPLHCAWAEEAVRFLLDRGANVHTEDGHSRRPLASICWAFYCIFAGGEQPKVPFDEDDAVSTLRVLLEAGADIPAASSCTDEHPFATVVEWGYPEAAQLLLDFGASPNIYNTASDEMQVVGPYIEHTRYGETAYTWVWKALLSAGMDVNLDPTGPRADVFLWHIPDCVAVVGIKNNGWLEVVDEVCGRLVYVDDAFKVVKGAIESRNYKAAKVAFGHLDRLGYDWSDSEEAGDLLRHLIGDLER